MFTLPQSGPFSQILSHITPYLNPNPNPGLDNAPDPTLVFVGGDGNENWTKACMHCGNSHVTRPLMTQGYSSVLNRNVH